MKPRNILAEIAESMVLAILILFVLSAFFGVI